MLVELQEAPSRMLEGGTQGHWTIGRGTQGHTILTAGANAHHEKQTHLDDLAIVGLKILGPVLKQVVMQAGMQTIWC